MSIEMQHSERLGQSIDGLKAAGPLTSPIGCGTVIALATLLFLLLAAPLLAQAPDAAWLAAFEAEHGFAPDADPGLLALGFTPEEALAEHISALEWSRALEHTPDMAEWEARWWGLYGRLESIKVIIGHGIYLYHD